MTIPPGSRPIHDLLPLGLATQEEAIHIIGHKSWLWWFVYCERNNGLVGVGADSKRATVLRVSKTRRLLSVFGLNRVSCNTCDPLVASTYEGFNNCKC